jgi:hypothetical protein
MEIMMQIIPITTHLMHGNFIDIPSLLMHLKKCGKT